MGRVVLAGGSGFLGTALSRELLRDSWEVVNLTRSPREDADGVRDERWDGRTVGDWATYVDGAASVVNLAGRSVDCRYTARNRAEIVNSRVDSVRAIAAAIRKCSVPPAVWIQAGSLAIYGDAGDRICDENAPRGQGFTVEVCENWERAFDAEDVGATRKVMLRIGFVLGRGGGALAKLAGLARWGLGGTTGSGRQWISWLHVHDLNRIMSWAMERESVSGIYNVTGPTPVRNREFMRELRRALGVWFGPPAPALAVRIGSFFMRTEASLALTGRRCSPSRLIEEGFDFQHIDLRQTMQDLLCDPDTA